MGADKAAVENDTDNSYGVSSQDEFNKTPINLVNDDPTALTVQLKNEKSPFSASLLSTTQGSRSPDSTKNELQEDEFKPPLNLTYSKRDLSSDSAGSSTHAEKNIISASRVTSSDGYVIDEDHHFPTYTGLGNTIESGTNFWERNLVFAAEETRLNETHDDQPLLYRMRNYIADFQEARGTPREEYTFSTLIRIMGQSTGKCLEALFYVLRNIIPVFELFIHILRFVFDKMIDINSTIDVQHQILKIVLFMVQLLSIYICLVFIFGFIVAPVVWMAFGILAKIMLYD